MESGEGATEEAKKTKKEDLFAALPASGSVNTKMKFGVLIGLIEVGEISNKDVVDTVFNLLIGGEFDLEVNFVIEEPDNVLHLLELLNHCSVTLQAEIWSMFIAILRKSIRNLQACTEISLVVHALERMKDADDMVADLLADLLGVLASYSITVKELKLLFANLRGDKGIWPRHASRLLKVLWQMPMRKGPDAFFSFPGKNGAALALPPVARWPYQNGFTFSTWFRMDPINSINIDVEKPYLYCFRTSKGVGYSGHFMGSCLVITTLKAKNKGYQHCIKFDFQPRKWYMVTIVHIYNRWRANELKCFVDGQLVSFGEMPWHINMTDPYDKCFLGSAPSADNQRVFCGQLSATYLFSEALSAEVIYALHLLGPNYKSVFRFQSESDLLLAEHHKKLLYDSRLSASIVFTYNPLATDSQLCLDSTPRSNPSYFVHSPHALMLQDVKAVVTHSVHSTLHSIGGIQTLFPLFTQLDFTLPNTEGSPDGQVDYSLCGTMLDLVCCLLRSSVVTQQQTVQGRGFMVLGHLIQKSSTKHLNERVLDTFLKLANYLNNQPNGVALLKNLVDHILFNPNLWIHTPPKVQMGLYTFLAKGFIGQTTIYNNIRRVSTVLQLMHTFKYYYWVVNPEDRSGITPIGLDGPRPSGDELTSIRTMLLLIIKQLILAEKKDNDDELESILNYLTIIHEDDNLRDVLHLLLYLMAEHGSVLTSAFDKKNGVRVIFKLLASPDEGVRIMAMKILAFFLSRLNSKRKTDLMYSHSLYALIGERLMLNSNTITMTTYNVLFEILTEKVTGQIIATRHPEPDKTYRVNNPAMFQVIAKLIRQSRPSPNVIEVKRLFISDMILLFNNSRENRRTLLQCSVWQDWLLSLGYFMPRNEEEKKVSEMVYSLMRMLLHHAIKYEWGGWRVWVDTMSIIHSKVSFEEHKQQLARIFDNYQRQETSVAPPTISRVVANGGGEMDGGNPLITATGGYDQDDVVFVESSPGADQAAGAAPPEAATVLANGTAEAAKRDREVRAFLDGVVGEVVQQIERKKRLQAATHQLPGERSAQGQEGPPPTQEAVTRQRSLTEGAATQNRGQSFSPGPLRTPYRIPEFKWSHVHQRMMSDLLFAIETDVQVWRSHSNKTAIDCVNSPENVIFVQNVTQMISQISDNLVYSCGGILPLLSSATSRNAEPDVIEPTQGMPLETGISLLYRIINLVDVLVFASSHGFHDMEAEKNLANGSILRQCLRLTACCSIRNCLESRFRNRPRSVSTPTELEGPSATTNFTRAQLRALIESAHSTPKNIVEKLLTASSPVKNVDKLLQDMDINRLRAVVYRDVEESKQAQFLALAVVYIVSVLMVSRYRDILESENISSSPRPPPLQQPHQRGREGSAGQGRGSSSSTGSHSVLEAAGGQSSPAVDKDASSTGATGQGPTESVLGEKAGGPGKESDVGEASAGVQEKGVEGDQEVAAEAEVGQGDTDTGSPEEVPDKPGEERDLKAAGDGNGENEETEADRTEDGGRGPGDDDKTGEAPQAEEHSTEVGEEDDAKERNEVQQEDGKEGGGGVVKNEEVAEREAGSEAEEENRTEEAAGGEETSHSGENSSPEDDSTIAASSQVEIQVTVANGRREDEEAQLQQAGDKENQGGEGGQARSQSVSSDAEAVAQPEVAAAASISQSVTTSEPGTPLEPVAPASISQSVPQAWSTASSQEAAKPPAGPVVPNGTGEGEGASPDQIPVPDFTMDAALNWGGGTVDERLQRSLDTTAPLLKEIFVDFAQFLSKTLLGSHGQELLIEGLVSLKSSSSAVELVMLLCSQEWQNSIQKHAGLAFIELINEGRLHSHATRDHMLRVANEAEFILNRQRADDVQKHAEFESLSATSVVDRKEEEKMCDHLINAARYRDNVAASRIIQKVVDIMTDKHGAWSNSLIRTEKFFKLDFWEDNTRRRRRFVKNPQGSSHSNATLQAALEHGASEDMIGRAREAVEAQLSAADGKRSSEEREEGDSISLQHDDKDLDLENELNGPLILSIRCSLVAPGIVANGTLSVTSTDLYFEVDEDHENYKKLDPQVLAYTENLHGKWSFSEVRAVFARRHLLQKTALEIFMANRTAVMFSLADPAAVKKVVRALPRVGVGMKYGISPARRVSLATPRQLFKASNMTQRWQRREISNFDYIMYLNTIAGRSYNDLNQYPVFPWVLTNYESNELDLTLPSNYRDLSKPVGALNPSRQAFFTERYKTWEDPKVPPFHYGTHYSTAGFTLAWLVRVEPFTSMFLNLQGGKFDHASRTFSSIAESWKNCQRDTSDVKELIPEFFYLSEMFVNNNKYTFGQRDDGKVVEAVDLPPWAKTPEEFVRLNRMALESEFVSCQLHQWIDLIFGYKQRGAEAERATNVFYYLTYEGSVNLESIKDPVMKEAVESQIRSFGQTPSQLMTEPHPPRSSAMHITPLMYSGQMQSTDVLMVIKFFSNSPVTHVSANTHPLVPHPAVVTVTCNQTFALNKWNNSVANALQSPGYSMDATKNLLIDMDTLLLSQQTIGKRQLGNNLASNVEVNSASFVVTSDNKHLVACGFWDNSFRVYNTDSGKISQVVFGHWDIVTCLARSECPIGADCYLVSGSRDATVLIWYWNSKTQCIVGDFMSSGELATPKAVLTGHDSMVVCLSICAELGLVVSGSKDGAVLIHTVQGELLRSLEPPGVVGSPSLAVLEAEAGLVLVTLGQNPTHLCLFTINGRLLQHTQVDDNIRTLTTNYDGNYFVTGGDKKLVNVWRTHDLHCLYTFPACDSQIRHLDLAHDQRTLIAGVSSGSIYVLSINFFKWHHEYRQAYN